MRYFCLAATLFWMAAFITSMIYGIVHWNAFSASDAYLRESVELDPCTRWAFAPLAALSLGFGLLWAARYELRTRGDA